MEGFLPIAFTQVYMPVFDELCKEFADYEPVRQLDASRLLGGPNNVLAFLATLGFGPPDVSIGDRFNPGVDHFMITLAGKITDEDYRKLCDYTPLQMLKHKDLVLASGTVRQWLDIIDSGCKEGSPYLVIANELYATFKWTMPDMFKKTITTNNEDGTFYTKQT